MTHQKRKVCRGRLSVKYQAGYSEARWIINGMRLFRRNRFGSTQQPVDLRFFKEKGGGAFFALTAENLEPIVDKHIGRKQIRWLIWRNELTKTLLTTAYLSLHHVISYEYARLDLLCDWEQDEINDRAILLLEKIKFLS